MNQVKEEIYIILLEIGTDAPGPGAYGIIDSMSAGKNN